jgi:hypothetical protein
MDRIVKQIQARARGVSLLSVSSIFLQAQSGNAKDLKELQDYLKKFDGRSVIRSVSESFFRLLLWVPQRHVHNQPNAFLQFASVLLDLRSSLWGLLRNAAKDVF